MDNNTIRNTFPVICPRCGTQQEAEPGQDAVICRSCGTPFSVQKGIDGYQERYGTLPGPNGEPMRVYPRPGQTFGDEKQKPGKRRIFWWVMGWIFCFPIPLTILMIRNRKLPAALRYGIIALGWIVYLALGVRSRAGMTERTPAVPEQTQTIVQTTSTPRPTPAPRAAETPEPAEEAAEETGEEASFIDGVTPEFKEVMDSYEAFFDEYCEFMKTMAEDPTDVTILLQYADFMSQYNETMEKLDAVDESELSPADDAYYIETMARIEVKLMEAANSMD